MRWCGRMGVSRLHYDREHFNNLSADTCVVQSFPTAHLCVSAWEDVVMVELLFSVITDRQGQSSCWVHHIGGVLGEWPPWSPAASPTRPGGQSEILFKQPIKLHIYSRRPHQHSSPYRKVQYVPDDKKNKPYIWVINHLGTRLGFDSITDFGGVFKCMWNHSKMDCVFLSWVHRVSVQHEKASCGAVTHLHTFPHGPHVFDISRKQWWWLLNGSRPKTTQNALIAHAAT